VIKSIQKESARLRNVEKCQILIGLGHYGFLEDQKMIGQVDLDVVIGKGLKI
jgi:hypothetical protein